MRKRKFCGNEYFFVTSWQKCNYAGRKTEIIICNFFTAMKSTYYAKNVIFVFIVHRPSFRRFIVVYDKQEL